MDNLQWLLLAGLVSYNIMLLTDMFADWIIKLAKLLVGVVLVIALFMVS